MQWFLSSYGLLIEKSVLKPPYGDNAYALKPPYGDNAYALKPPYGGLQRIV